MNCPLSMTGRERDMEGLPYTHLFLPSEGKIKTTAALLINKGGRDNWIIEEQQAVSERVISIVYAVCSLDQTGEGPSDQSLGVPCCQLESVVGYSGVQSELRELFDWQPLVAVRLWLITLGLSYVFSVQIPFHVTIGLPWIQHKRIITKWHLVK